MIKTHEKYLPLMRNAVKNGKAKARNLALLEDRVALREGKKQIYGTQVIQKVKTNEYFVLPLDDPYNVDLKRAEAGLQPLSVYLEDNFKTKWDIAQYLKDLPFIEATKSKSFLKNLMNPEHYLTFPLPGVRLKILITLIVTMTFTFHLEHPTIKCHNAYCQTYCWWQVLLSSKASF